MKKLFCIVVFAFIGTFAFTQQPVVAVTPFDILDNAVTAQQANMITDVFFVRLDNTKAVRLVNRTIVERVIKEHQFQLEDWSNEKKTAAFKEALNADWIVQGNIRKMDNSLLIIVHFYDIKTFESKGSADLRLVNVGEAYDKINPLVESLIKTIGAGVGREQPIPAGLLYEIVDGKAVTITKYTGNAVALNIPSHIEGLFVTSIGLTAFYDCSSLTSVTIPSTVTSINEAAFYNCSSLTSITVDNRNPVYTSVDGILFDKNIRTLIRYPQGRNQGTYVIPSSITSIGDYSFKGCNNLSNITIPSSVRSIGDFAFSSCHSLTSVIIPSSVTSLSRNAFFGCRILTSINVDNRNSVYASIDGVLFDKTIRTIISYPMGRNQRIYVIPSSVMSIGDLAFDISSLTAITIPSTVTSIGNRAFSYCGNLTSITIPSSVTSIGESVFMGSTNLASISVDNRNSFYASIDGVLFDKNIRNLIEYPEGKNQGNYVIPSSVTHIGIGAFYNSTLASITLPSSITYIGFAAFESCRSLTSITIPSSVTHIEDSAFSSCYSLTSVTLSRRTQVGKDAFPASVRIIYRD